MKKLLLLLALGFGLFVFAPTASALDPTTIVNGQVTENGTPVGGANVTVVCNGHNRTATTNAQGKYVVTYDEVLCPDGKTATVVAQKGGMGGSNTGTVEGTGVAGLNVAIVNVAIPEFGLLTGAAGLAAAGGLFVFMRRRQQTVNAEQN
jgi:hypothetical protein